MDLQPTEVVTLRWEEAGEEMPHILHDIQPDGSGRLDWAAVEESFCADVVNIVGASTPSVFRNGASQGLTRLLFKPGGTIRVIVMRKAPGGQARCQILPAAAERSSVTLQASKSSEDEIAQMMEGLTCTVVWKVEDPGLTGLLGPPPEQGGMWDDEAAEPAQRDLYSSLLEEHLPHRAKDYAKFELHDVRSETMEITAAGVSYKLAGKADELIAVRRYHHTPMKGGIMGVRTKKRLAWRSVIQVQAEYLLYATSSFYPFCMVATDFVKGGIALYHTDDAKGLRIIVGRVLKGMDSFWQFFTDYLSSLPENLGVGSEVWADEVPNPKRRRFRIELEGSPEQQVQNAMQHLVSFYNGLGDVANLDDLQGFQELDSWA